MSHTEDASILDLISKLLASTFRIMNGQVVNVNYDMSMQCNDTKQLKSVL